MLAIQKQSGSDDDASCTPNILPCRVNRNYAVNAAERYWKPENAEDKEGKQTSYFRGRKLEGEVVNVPEGYRGVVLQNTDRIVGKEGVYNAEEEGQNDEVKIAIEVAEFDVFVVWGHDRAPDQVEDPYVKGVQEWIGFAEAMNSYPADEQAKKS